MRRSLVALAVLSSVWVTNAHAEEPYNPRLHATPTSLPAPTYGPMRVAMHAYFEGEKREGWVFAGAGVVGLGAGGLGAFAAKDDVYRGAGVPLMVLGLVQLAAGVILLVRTDDQIAERDAKLDRAPRAFFAEERPRIDRVRGEFEWLRIAELGLTVAGIGIASYGDAERQRFVFGIGAGLAIESTLMLAFDGLASARADRYDAAMRAFDPEATRR